MHSPRVNPDSSCASRTRSSFFRPQPQGEGSIELEDEQPQDNFRLKAKRGGDNGGLREVLLIHFEFFPMIPLRKCIPSTRTTRGLGPNSGACAYMLVPAAAGRGG